MKLLVTVHNSMFDAALPLLKRLKELCDLHCLLEFDMQEDNIFGITEDTFGEKFYLGGRDVLKGHIFASFLPIENTTLIKYYPPKSVFKHIKTQYYENIVIRSINPEFIYYFNIPLQSSLYILFNRGKWATAVHDPIPHSNERKLNVLIRGAISWPIYKYCQHYFLFSENLVEKFKEARRLSSQKVYLTKLGPYETLNINGELSQDAHEEIRLLFFGKIKSYKGLRYLLEAYRILKEEHQAKVTLTIAGSGYIEKDIIDLNMYPDLYVHNRYITNDELSTFIKNCDIVVCPYTDATQSGVIMSSYAFCKPVIATNVGGLSEMVENEVNGTLIEPGSSSHIVDAVLKILNNKETINNWSQNLREKYFEGEFGWNSIAAKLLNQISEILYDVK